MILPERIVKAIWEKSGLDCNSPKSYYTLSLLILDETGEKLGENTIKRIFGQLNDDRAPHTHTLDTLSRYLGFRNWNQLSSSSSPGDSGFSKMDGILSANLTAGQHVVFTYAPDREIEMEFKGGTSYTVIRSHGSSLKAGDILEIGGLHCNFPLVSSSVMRNGENLGQYYAAEKLGISSITLI